MPIARQTVVVEDGLLRPSFVWCRSNRIAGSLVASCAARESARCGLADTDVFFGATMTQLHEDFTSAQWATQPSEGGLLAPVWFGPVASPPLGKFVGDPVVVDQHEETRKWFARRALKSQANQVA